MALTRVETQILFATASSITVSSNAAAFSDALVFDATTVMVGVVVSCDNAGTPASGDWVDFWWASSTGDVLGDSNNDYETAEHAMPLGRVDTVAANTPGEDPARKYFELPAGATAGKLVYQCNQAATRNVVIRARAVEVRAA
jgi:hypothetical protein